MVNRLEKEAMDNVDVLLQGQFGNLYTELTDCVAEVKKIVGSGDVQLPTEMEEQLNDACRDMGTYLASYKDRVDTFRANNAKINADLQARMATSRKSTESGREGMKSAQTTTEGIKSSLK